MRSSGFIRRTLWISGAAAFAWASASAFAREARADWDFQFAAGMNASWLRKNPALDVQGASTSAREQEAGRLPMRGSLVFLSPYLDTALTIDDRWSVPLVGGALYWPIGSYDSVVTTYDGSIATVRPWTAFRGDFLLPGFGGRFKHRRTMLGAAIRTGLSWVKIDGSVAAGLDSEPLNLSAATFLLQAELEACRRLDPVTRACVLVTPRVYEYQFGGGVSVGLRMEWGR